MVFVAYNLKRLKTLAWFLKSLVKLIILAEFLCVNSQTFDIESINPNLSEPSLSESGLPDLENYEQSQYSSNHNQNQYRYESDCYDAAGVAKKCMPEFINAAFGLKILASNTCGLTHSSEYCEQTNLHNF